MIIPRRDYRNELSHGKRRNQEPFPEPHLGHISQSVKSHSFSQHAEHTRCFRLAHDSMEKAKDSQSWARRLGPILPSSLLVMLRNSCN